MTGKKILITLTIIIALIVTIILLGYGEILWLTGLYLISGILFIGNIIFEFISNPYIYPFFYWFTYISAIIAVFTVIATLLWYWKTRKKFSSPLKKKGLSAVGFIGILILTLGISQILLSILQQDLLYQVSFGLFIISIIFLGVRTFVNISTSLAYRSKVKDLKNEPLVSIILPAYNEGIVIKKTIESLLNLNYNNKEIIVVDDGSKDDTLKIAQEIAAKKPIKVITKSNGGKWSALNTGIKASKGEIIVCIDADTILDENSIKPLISHFEDEKVAAVAGNIKVGNRNKMLTKLQALEYVSGLNIQRRSESYFSKITVVPGPLGAFRKSVVNEVGLYTGDTFAEDADLTLKILRAGYKIKYERKALGYTEAPNNMMDLGKQRYRWYRGLLQSMTKHKDMLFNSKYGTTGLFMIPWIFFNGLIFSWFTFFTLLWLFILMFNPFSGFVIYRPQPQGPPTEPPGSPWEGPGGPGGGGGPGSGGGTGSGYGFGDQIFAQTGSELVVTINFFQAIPVIYIFWFFFFLILEVIVTLYAIAVDIKEKPKLAFYVIAYKLCYGYIIDTIRILSQLEQYFKYPMKWETAKRSGEIAKQVQLS